VAAGVKWRKAVATRYHFLFWFVQQMQRAEPEDGLHYASVQYSQRRRSPAGAGPAGRPGEETEGEDEAVVYAAVAFGAAASRSELWTRLAIMF